MSSPPTLAEALDALLRFGGLMLRSGDSAFRVRDAMNRLAPRLGIEDFAVAITVSSLMATARRSGEHLTLVHHVGPLGINAWRLGALERLEGTGALTPAELQAKVAAIAAAPLQHRFAVVAVFVGLASGAFAHLNGGNIAAVLAAAVAGGIGQFVRSLLLARQFNQYAVATFCAVVAGGGYLLIAALLARIGLAPEHGIGVVAAALFLVPGFPLVAALLDLLQQQTTAGLVRLAYGTTLLLAAALGLGVIVGVAGLSVPAVTAPANDLPLTVLLRGIASFLGGCGFAVLYNSAWRTVLVVGVLALLGNEVRLSLQDAGASQAAATFTGTLAVGLLASVVQPRLREPRIALTVPGIIIMVPGSFAFHAVVLFSQGDVLGGLQAAAVAGFVVGAMALGLAAARFASERRWLRES